MAQSGVSLSPECVDAFNELKLQKQVKYIIYKISDDGKEIVVEQKSSDKEYEQFMKKLLAVGMPRYVVYDVQYDLESGEGTRNKIVFIMWAPDTAPIKPKMLYSSSKDALRRALNGVAMEIQANDPDDIEWSSILSKVQGSRR